MNQETYTPAETYDEPLFDELAISMPGILAGTPLIAANALRARIEFAVQKSLPVSDSSYEKQLRAVFDLSQLVTNNQLFVEDAEGELDQDIMERGIRRLLVPLTTKISVNKEENELIKTFLNTAVERFLTDADTEGLKDRDGVWVLENRREYLAMAFIMQFLLDKKVIKTPELVDKLREAFFSFYKFNDSLQTEVKF